MQTLNEIKRMTGCDRKMRAIQQLTAFLKNGEQVRHEIPKSFAIRLLRVMQRVGIELQPSD
jgi:hypothetical protein